MSIDGLFFEILFGDVWAHSYSGAMVSSVEADEQRQRHLHSQSQTVADAISPLIDPQAPAPKIQIGPLDV